MHARYLNLKLRSTLRSFTRTVVFFAVVLVFPATMPVGQVASPLPSYQVPDPGKDSEERLAYFAYLLEELDVRRRLQFLFPNPQSIFDGVSLGFVQTSSGNLTFERRDLVVIGEETILASRIHDSRNDLNFGFGPGWQLNLAETLNVEDDRVIYQDDNGAKHAFKRIERASLFSGA